MTKYFPLMDHGNLRELLPGIFELTGSMKLFGLFKYSRNMHLLNTNDGVILINPVRVSEPTLAEITKIGRINHVYKLGQLHNVDVPFYVERFKPKVWKNKNDPTLPDIQGDYFFEDYDTLPLCGSKVYRFEDSKLAETVLIHPESGGILLSCDAYVNMGPDPMANFLTKTLSKLLPRPTYVGPNWVKIAKPSLETLKGILDFEFKNLMTAHGDAIIGDAYSEISTYLAKYRL